MNEFENRLRSEISEHRTFARKLFDEVVWIREQIPALPFFKKASALKKISDLERKVVKEAEKIIELEKHLKNCNEQH